MNLGSYIKNLRASRGLLQKQLADRLQVHPSYVSNLESGVRISLGTMMSARLKTALELSDDEVERLGLLAQAAKGRLEIPLSATEQEIEVFTMLAGCVGRMPIRQLEAIRMLLEPWAQADHLAVLSASPIRRAAM